MQSRIICVKCRLYGELTVGRKVFLRYMIRIPLLQLDNQIFFNLILSLIVVLDLRRRYFFMKKYILTFKDSLNELKNVRCITLAAMFGAISIVLGGLGIQIGNFLKINFTFLPNNFIFYLFGPVVGMIFGLAMDVLTFIIKPTGPYFVGFTISAILNGLIYGMILYKKPISLKRILFANIIVFVVVRIFLNTYWLSILFGNGFFTLLPIRVFKELIMFPIETTLFYMLLKGLKAYGITKITQDKKARI